MTKKPAKRSRKKKQIYSGALAKPGHSRLRLPLEGRTGDVDTFYGKRSAKEIIAHNAVAIYSEAENLRLLMDHYGIDRDHEDGWCLLAFALARDHVPAFRPPPARGAPKKDIDKLAVYSTVRKVMREEIAKIEKLPMQDRYSVTENWAIKKVKKSEYPNTSEKTVAGWYYEAVKTVQFQAKELDELRINEGNRLNIRLK
jgi:hypothetical protein